jgi:ribosomal protein L24
VHVSNVMVVDPDENVPTRVGRKVSGEGKLTRFARKSGAFLDVETSAAKKGRKGRKPKE